MPWQSYSQLRLRACGCMPTCDSPGNPAFRVIRVDELPKLDPDSHIDSSEPSWLWAESLSTPLVALNLADRKVVAVNSAAAQLLEADVSDLIDRPSSILLPDYLLPTREAMSQWIAEATEKQQPGAEVDLLVELAGSQPRRFSARIGPVDPTGEFALLSLEKPEEESTTRADEPEDALLGLMSDIGRIVGSSLNLDAVSQRFAISLMHVVPAEHVAILLLGDDGESLESVFSTGYGPLGITTRLSDDGPIRRAVKTQSAVLLDMHEIEEFRQTGATSWAYLDESLLTACCVPLVTSGQCIGVALLASALSGAFTSDDLELLENASSQVAGAISNLMLHEKLAEGAVERDVLASVGRLASSDIEFAGAMPEIAAEIRRFMPISELCLYEPDDITGDLVRAYTWTESGDETDLDPASQAEAADDREAALHGAGPVTSTVRMVKDSKSAASATAPMRFGGETIGTLTVISANSERYTSREATFASLVASQIAGAVHTARVYRNQQRETNLRRSLAQISLAASKDLTPDSVFERIANEVAELIEYDLFAIALLTPDRTGVSVRFHIGVDEVLRLYDPGDAQSGVDAVEWRVSVCRRASEDERFSELAEAGIGSAIEVSLGTKESGATGYMLVGSHKTSAFSNHELRTLAEIAAQVTPAIQNATAHEQAVALAEARMSEARAEARNLELEKINDAKSQFLSVVSHELRTPLTSIIAYAELLERNTQGNMNEKEIAQAKIINKSAMHLKFLISDLLDVSRIESGNLSLEMSRFEIAEVISDVVDQFEPVLAEKEQELEVHVARESILLHADRSRIVQIVSNLVENASKYSQPKTVITVNVHRRGSEVRISVSDEGIGISEEDQRQLFVPFFRANSDLTRTEPGTGLGLALVKSIAELHAGSVSVESEPGKGSTFSVMLRAASSEAAA